MFEAIYARGAVAEQLTDRAWVRAMSTSRRRWRRRWRSSARFPRTPRPQIAAAARDTGRIDFAQLRSSLAENATPVIGLVAALRDAVDPPAAEHVHSGATSQDIVDTALMLVVRRALNPLLADLDGAADAAAVLAATHRATPMIARTLLQQALPTTFGLVSRGLARRAHPGASASRSRSRRGAGGADGRAGRGSPAGASPLGSPPSSASSSR